MPTEQDDIVQELETQFSEGLEGIEPRSFGPEFPRGVYAFRCTNAYLSRSAASGRKQLVAVTTVVEAAAGDEFVGETYTKTWGLETEENWEWFKRDMIALDIDPPKDAKELLRICNELTNACFQGTLVPNTDEQYPPNCFLNKGARREDLETGTEEKKDSSRL